MTQCIKRACVRETDLCGAGADFTDGVHGPAAPHGRLGSATVAVGGNGVQRKHSLYIALWPAGEVSENEKAAAAAR
jgi:hypothetical protein